MMYEAFYGFTEKPFQVVPNPAFLYRSSKHDAALSYLEYGLKENVGFILLTGEVGSGKTTIVQYMVSRVERAIDTAVIFNTNVTADELLHMILEEFEVPRPAGDKAAVLSALNRFLIEHYARRKRVLLIIDESQNLSDPALEEIRLMSNLHTDQHALLQIMLVGQPELLAKLKKPSLRQFTQRIAASYHLTGLNQEETGKYILHRLRKAGCQKNLFTEAAVGLIYQFSGGIPRSINLACQAALVYGFAEGATQIGQDIIKQIQEDNVGIGLPAAMHAAETQSPAAGESEERNGYKRRMQELESELQALKRAVSDRVQVLEQHAEKYRDEVVLKLEKLLRQERQRSEELARRNARLEVENQALHRLRRKT